MNRIAISTAALLTATPALAATEEPSGGALIGGFLLLAFLFAGYFFPSIIAAFRKHHNLLAIFLLNLFLGWSGLGWVGALVWAATTTGRRDC